MLCSNKEQKNKCYHYEKLKYVALIVTLDSGQKLKRLQRECSGGWKDRRLLLRLGRRVVHTV